MSDNADSSASGSAQSSWWDNTVNYISGWFGGNSTSSSATSTGNAAGKGKYTYVNRDGVTVEYTKPPPQHELKYLTPTQSEGAGSLEPSTMESIWSSVKTGSSELYDKVTNLLKDDPGAQAYARQNVEPQGGMSSFLNSVGNYITGDYSPLEATPSVNKPVEALGRTLGWNVNAENLADYSQLVRALGFAMVVSDHRKLRTAMMLHAAADIGEGYFDTRGAGRPGGLNVSGVLEPYVLLASMAVSGYSAELAKELE